MWDFSLIKFIAFTSPFASSGMLRTLARQIHGSRDPPQRKTSFLNFSPASLENGSFSKSAFQTFAAIARSRRYE